MNEAAPDLHSDQIAYWNGAGGDHWVQRQELTDRVLAPVAEVVLARAAAQPGERVIDIGCGCGATTLVLADQVAPGGTILAADVSEPMLGRARERLAGRAGVSLVCADAARHPFTATAADLLFSRFGVMFFGDPTAAFANMRQGLKPGGRLVFACWRVPSENSWMMVPLQAAYLHVPRLPKPGPEDPGPFSFGDPERVRRILAGAGFTGVALEPIDLDLDLASGGGLDAAVAYTLDIGATSRALDGASGALRTAAAGSVREALAPYVDGNRVPLPAAIWIVTATAP
ncbi:MAG TPA: methyltransferase domain-containing protein [Aliidongia sp.]|uniref:class I SAM-dependent methyltransferase n=1 Tax=Aliidongia sp. TaxID=1914230 RepID=UPI002DDCEE57|nr:methyltransferase domain-containing protein [Aliidongia sp.]HEV2678310.1 methyltransferase domain-containing protein [Aliidongia sp.]